MSEGIRDDKGITVVGWRDANKVGDVGRTRRARLVLETLVVGLDLVAIDADLYLGGEGDVGARIGW
jgi:hypothetical protein